jgi:hypothetical protein
MIQGRSTKRLKQLVLGGALAALLAVGAAGSGVAGDPSQWGLTAGDPSQWGRGTQQALNFTKIEFKTGAKGSPQDLHVTMSAPQAISINFAKIEF